MNSLLHHVVVLATTPDLFSVVLRDLILLTGRPRSLIFEDVPGTFKVWGQLAKRREGRVICRERARSPLMPGQGCTGFKHLGWRALVLLKTFSGLLVVFQIKPQTSDLSAGLWGTWACPPLSPAHFILTTCSLLFLSVLFSVPSSEPSTVPGTH